MNSNSLQLAYQFTPIGSIGLFLVFFARTIRLSTG